MRKDQEQQQTRIVQDLDFPALYRSYEWINDTWENGFPDLFRLEKEISSAARQNAIRREHLVKIAKWGKLPNVSRIACPNPIKISLYQNDLPAPWLVAEPHNTVLLLQHQIVGFGPTYISKLLHFAVPQICGALDTRLVRVFGKKAQKYPLLNLSAQNIAGRWSIPATQAGWPDEYGTWVKILKLTADHLNTNKIQCPYPSVYIQSGLRTNGIWLPADVETALFAYASKELASKK